MSRRLCLARVCRLELQAILGILAFSLLAGCDSVSFVPPRPAGLAGGPEARPKTEALASPAHRSAAADEKAPTGKTGSVELILRQPQTGDRQLLERILFRDFGKARVPFRVVKPETDKPFDAERLAKEIGLAAARGVAVLVVEPLDAPEVRTALQDAEARGVAVLLLDHPLPSRRANRTLPTISLKGFDECATALAVTALEDARLLGLPGDGEVVLIQNRAVDGYSKQRQDSIKSAVKALGRTLLVLEFEGDRYHANTMLVDFLKAHPKVTVILTEEDYGLGAAIDLHRTRSSLGPVGFILGGYASYDLRIDPEVAKRCCAFIERGLADYATRIPELAQAAIAGKPLPELTQAELVFIRMEPAHFTKPATEQKK